MYDWGALESTLDPVPDFPVQAPDGVKTWTELQRQTTLLRLIHMAGSRVPVWAQANAGKRNPMQARREGIVAGVFDLQFAWRGPLTAFVEMKGYTKAGRAGSLSRQQIEWGNRLHALGHHVACFYCPYAALDWLRSIGFPIANIEIAP